MDGNTNSTLDTLRLAALRVWPHNTRKTIPDLADLTASVAKVGVLSPLLVRPLAASQGDVTHEVITGQCRYLAAVAAGLAEVPVIVRALTDAEALEIGLTENAQRNAPPAIEEAEAIDALIRTHGRSPDDVAARLGRDPRWVRRRLSLLALVPEARRWLASGKLPLGHALALAAVDAEAQGRVCERWRVSDELPPARRWAGEVATELRTLASAPFDVDDAALPGGACGSCPRSTAAQADLFGGADATARCTSLACWQGKVDAVWAAAQKAAKKRRLPVIAGTVDVGWRGEAEVDGRTLTTSGAEGARPVAVGRDRWGRVHDLYERPAVEPEGDDRTAGDEAPAADHRSAAVTRRDAAQAARRAALGKLLDALATPDGLAAGLRAALLTCARDLDMSRDLRALVEAGGGSALAQTDAELADGAPANDVPRLLVATILAAWASDADAEDESAAERDLRARMTAPPVPTVRVWIAEAAWDALDAAAREDMEEPIGGAPIAWQGTEGWVFADVPADEVLASLRGLAEALEVRLHEGAERPAAKARKGSKK